MKKPNLALSLLTLVLFASACSNNLPPPKAQTPPNQNRTSKETIKSGPTQDNSNAQTDQRSEVEVKTLSKIALDSKGPTDLSYTIDASKDGSMSASIVRSAKGELKDPEIEIPDGELKLKVEALLQGVVEFDQEVTKSDPSIQIENLSMEENLTQGAILGDSQSMAASVVLTLTSTSSQVTKITNPKIISRGYEKLFDELNAFLIQKIEERAAADGIKANSQQPPSTLSELASSDPAVCKDLAGLEGKAVSSSTENGISSSLESILTKIVTQDGSLQYSSEETSTVTENGQSPKVLSFKAQYEYLPAQCVIKKTFEKDGKSATIPSKVTKVEKNGTSIKMESALCVDQACEKIFKARSTAEISPI